ncbi:hypothetical protein FRD01_23930 [Microvenator marinus]|uniref:Uncharacterized protein n=1 Tax=Microvenator marinus TaxID=2600177 RepID=A0A5B8XX60_9DELT|nr:hypothetical protein [Microvenator marinus]QED30225.1 hypothetical protein FRD01_23930 [Microvenator marinus]
MKRVEWKPEGLVVLGFYDGVTECFFRRLGGLGPGYLTLIAWDENQNQRLFAGVYITLDMYNSVTQLLGSNEWPDCQSFSPATRAAIDEIIVTCRASLVSEGWLMMVADFESQSERLLISGQMAEAVERALLEPENIANWTQYTALCE